jgi:hypothetical protein
VKYLTTALIAALLCAMGWLFEQYMQAHYGHDCTWLTEDA